MMKCKELLILCIVIILMSGVMYAEETENEVALSDTKDLFTQFENFYYDRFDKRWCYSETVVKQYNNANVNITLEVDGYADGGIEPCPYISIIVEDILFKTSLYELTKVQFLIDEVVYTFEPVIHNGSYTILMILEEDKGLIEALADADSISAKLTWNDGYGECDLDSEEYRPLKEMAQYLEEIDIWKYSVVTKETIDHIHDNQTITITE